jgi:hypothetical protein
MKHPGQDGSGSRRSQAGTTRAAPAVGDVVIRSHRLLKTRGTIVGDVTRRPGEARQVWVKWDHADTLPNPSREDADDLELVKRPDESASGSGSGIATIPLDFT